MLTYHHAVDPYHADFRMLSTLMRAEEHSISSDKLRILDFYRIFPSYLGSIKFPKDLRTWRKKVRIDQNPYHVRGNPQVLFQQLRPVQESAINLLVAQGLITIDVDKNITLSQVPDSMVELMEANKPEGYEEVVAEFLSEHLAALPLSGDIGLKARSGLMEARYDAV